MSVLFYRRPDYVAKLPGPMSLSQCQVYVERTQKHKRAIPAELSFDKIIQNKALPPCGLQDFMDYLVYVSHDAENLQFYLWLLDYTKRFYAAPPSEQELSPPWSPQQYVATYTQIPPSSSASSDLKSDLKISQLSGYSNTFESMEPKGGFISQFDKQSIFSSSTKVSVTESVQDANNQVGLKWSSFTIQPFHGEINRIIANYLSPDSPRELNLSYKTRTEVLHALQHTTHPSAFQPVREIVEASLRGQSHPNFIRWSICNGNKPRVLFVRNSGIAHVVLAVVVAVLCVLSNQSRWLRLLVFPLLLVGISIGIAAYRGLCVIIHTGHKRALRPWEQFGASSLKPSRPAGHADEEADLSTDDIFPMTGSPNLRSSRTASLDTFGTANTFGHETWVSAYKKKPLLQKIFAQSIWVQDETIRVLQDRIVWQSYLLATMASIPLTAIVIALPKTGVI